MARTLSITDDDTGVTASMRVEEVDGQSRITRLQFDAVDGATIRAEDLRIVRYFGLELPPPVEPVALPQQPKNPAPREPQPAAGTAPRKQARPAAKPQAKRQARHTGGPPSDAVLQSLYRTHGGMLTAMGRAAGCHPTTVRAWLAQARERGVAFTLEPPVPAIAAPTFSDRGAS